MHFEVTQQPDAVEVGGEVKVVCKATTPGDKGITYSWRDEQGNELKNVTSTNTGGTSTLTVHASAAMVVLCRAMVDGEEKPEVKKYPINIGESCVSVKDPVTCKR